MRLSRTGETGLLRALFRRHRAVMPAPPEGPGDDAAVVGPHLVTTDALLEGVHFLRSDPAFLTGRKALSVNLSDVAAMGGRPEACLLTLAAPRDLRLEWIRALAEGFASVAAEAPVRWVGGDIVRTAAGVALSVTVLARKGRGVLTRSGARPGDGLYVSGPLGASAAGRALLAAGWRVRSPGPAARRRWRWEGEGPGGGRLQRLVAGARKAPSKGGGRRRAAPSRAVVAALAARHLDPVPRLAEGSFLSSRGLASAAMDLSDGLSLDLARLCEASGVGADILREAVPILPETRLWASAAGVDPFELAVNGGEDYELLFTVPERAEGRLRAWPGGRGTGAFRIGRIRPRGRGIRVVDSRGRASRLKPGGYDAFRARGA